MVHVILMTGLLASMVWAQNSTNTTTPATSNSTQCPTPNIPGHFYSSDCKFLCRPTLWTDVLVFFLGNYVAHAATVVTKPGQSTLSSVVAIITALLFPGSGVRNGVDAIMSRAKWAKTDLMIAARAGALCAVVKVDETDPEPTSLDDGTGTHDGGAGSPGPQSRHSPDGVQLDALSPLSPEVAERVLEPLEPNKELPKWRRADVHGYVSLPKGYVLMVVPSTSTFMVDRDIPASAVVSGSESIVLSRNQAAADDQLSAESVPKKERKTTLSCSYNIVKILISLVQALFAAVTIYRTRGDQIDRYGAFAFGFTTVPYAWMSLVNLAGNLLCPQYSTMYVVGSSGLDHLRQRLEDAGLRDKNRFGVAGEIGRLTVEADSQLIASYQKLAKVTPQISMGFLFRSTIGTKTGFISIWVTFVPILFTVSVSIPLFGFGDGSIGPKVIAFFVMWYLIGATFAVFSSPASTFEGRPYIRGLVKHSGGHNFGLVSNWFVYSAAAIGGYVIVGQMLLESGVCSAL